jgi:hypothetical protein
MDEHAGIVGGVDAQESAGNPKENTQTAPAPTSIPYQRVRRPSLGGSRRVVTTSLMAGSTRRTAEWLRTQTPPAPTARSVGSAPSPMVRTTFRDFGSIRRSVWSSRLP